MFAKVHPPAEVRSGNKGSCIDLANYLAKEQRSDKPFFSHGGGYSSVDQVVLNVDNNKKALGKDDSKFFMLTLNPSLEEQKALIKLSIGKEIDNIDRLTVEEKQQVFGKLEDFTRKAMDEYALNFGRANVQSGGDLMYYASVETERIYKIGDPEVSARLVKIGDPKPGLNLHVHVIVSRKSLDGKVKLSPEVISEGNTWELNGKEVKRGFSHVRWKEQVQKVWDKEVSKSNDSLEAVKNTNREKILSKINNDDLKDILSLHTITSANQAAFLMQEKGYEVKRDKGFFSFRRDGKRLSISFKDLKNFVGKISPYKMDEILIRTEEAGTFSNMEEFTAATGMKIESAIFNADGKEIRYLVVHDMENQVSVPLSKLREHAAEKDNTIGKEGLRNVSKLETLYRVENADLKEILTDHSVTSGNQITFLMQEKGYTTERQGTDVVFTPRDDPKEQFSISVYELNRFARPVTPRMMNDILVRTAAAGQYAGLDEFTAATGIKIESATFNAKGKEIRYLAIHDMENQVSVPLAKLREHAEEQDNTIGKEGLHNVSKLETLYRVENADLKEILTDHSITSGNQITFLMQEKGYTTERQGTDMVFTSPDGEESFSIPAHELSRFSGAVAPEMIDDILSRMETAGQYASLDEFTAATGMKIESAIFNADGKEIRYLAIHDMENQVSVPLSKLREHAEVCNKHAWQAGVHDVLKLETLHRIENADLKEILTDHSITSGNQITFLMQEKGYTTERQGTDMVFTSPDGEESFSVPAHELSRFVQSAIPEKMDSILARMETAGQYASLDEFTAATGIKTEEVTFLLKEEISLDVDVPVNYITAKDKERLTMIRDGYSVDQVFKDIPDEQDDFLMKYGLYTDYTIIENEYMDAHYSDSADGRESHRYNAEKQSDDMRKKTRKLLDPDYVETKEVKYFVIHDLENKVSVPLSKLREHAGSDSPGIRRYTKLRFISMVNNTDLADCMRNNPQRQWEVNYYMRQKGYEISYSRLDRLYSYTKDGQTTTVPAHDLYACMPRSTADRSHAGRYSKRSDMVTTSISHSIGGKIKNKAMNEIFQGEFRTERRMISNAGRVARVLINPKAALLHEIKNFLNPVKYL